MPTLIVVDPGQVAFSALCEDCLRERQIPDAEHHRFTDEERSGLCIRGELALDRDAGSGTCMRGHRYRVMREGSEGGRH